MTVQADISPVFLFCGEECEMEIKSDIEIAQACEMKHIRDIAAVAGVDEDYLEYYGKTRPRLT